MWCGFGGPARVPVLDVHAGNAAACWDTARQALTGASFIAMDAPSSVFVFKDVTTMLGDAGIFAAPKDCQFHDLSEMSGLGNRKALLAQSIEERYVAIRNAARTRSLLSIGIACFRLLPEKGCNWYEVQVLNLTLLSKEDYTVEPQSLTFLVEHGFDFNKQYTQGLPYRPGNDMTGAESAAPGARALFSEVVLAERPLVLHNGLLDLAFLFQALHAALPPTLQTFVADLATLLPAGVYDTKHLAETETDMPASFLEYAFRKCTRGGLRSGGLGSGVRVEFVEIPSALSPYVDERLCAQPRAGPVAGDGAAMQAEPALCQRFSAYGWCQLGVKCPLSHDIERILDEDEKLAQSKRQRRPRPRKKPRSGKPTDDNGPSGQAGAPADDQANVADIGADAPLDNPGVEPSEGEVDRGENRSEEAAEKNEARASPDGQCVYKRASGLPDDPTAKRPKIREEKPEAARSGERDSGALDSGALDSGALDSGALDSGAIDSGALDSGALDSGALDAPLKIGSPGKTAEPGNGKEEPEPKPINSVAAVASGSHRAGFDAFMTGFVFASILAFRKGASGGGAGNKAGEEAAGDATENWLPGCRNKLYLSGKAMPLHVCKSAFSSSSRAHRDTMARLGKQIE